MIKGLFITGTATDIGKTYVTSRIIKELKQQYHVGYYKAALSASFVMSSVRTPASLPSLINATLGTVVMPRRLAMPADL